MSAGPASNAARPRIAILAAEAITALPPDFSLEQASTRWLALRPVPGWQPAAEAPRVWHGSVHPGHGVGGGGGAGGAARDAARDYLDAATARLPVAVRAALRGCDQVALTISSSKGLLAEWHPMPVAAFDSGGKTSAPPSASAAAAFSAWTADTLGAASTLARECGGLSLLGCYPAACATGLTSLAAAADALAWGAAKMACAGSAEACLGAWPLAGFLKLGALSTEPSRPFERGRAGFNPGDGAGLFVLAGPGMSGGASGGGSSSDSKCGDGGDHEALAPIAWLCGIDFRSDAASMTGVDASGATLAHSIRRTLAQADWRPADVHAIIAHGTGTQANDAAEASAIGVVWGSGSGKVQASVPPLICLKPAIGHLLGASAAAELALAIRMARLGWLPASADFSPDHFDHQLPVRPATTPARHPQRLLKLALGFGGHIATAAVEVKQAGAHGEGVLRRPLRGLPIL